MIEGITSYFYLQTVWYIYSMSDLQNFSVRQIRKDQNLFFKNTKTKKNLINVIFKPFIKFPPSRKGTPYH